MYSAGVEVIKNSVVWEDNPIDILSCKGLPRMLASVIFLRICAVVYPRVLQLCILHRTPV